MIYEWKCDLCGLHIEIERPAEEYKSEPVLEEYEHEHEDGTPHEWERCISSPPSVPFIQLRDRGVFMDEHGNYPPRKIDLD